MSANLVKDLIYIDSSSIMKFGDFWTNTLSKGYLDTDDIFNVSPTAYKELRTTYVLTFLFFFSFFWINYLFLTTVIKPGILMKKTDIRKRYEMVVLINGNLHHLI